jgi:hypothetical protein
VIRLATVVNTAGASSVPSPAAPTLLSAAGAIPLTGGTRVYQAWYRNPASSCTPSAFNLTNGVRIAWRP